MYFWMFDWIPPKLYGRVSQLYTDAHQWLRYNNMRHNKRYLDQIIWAGCCAYLSVNLTTIASDGSLPTVQLNAPVWTIAYLL